VKTALGRGLDALLPAKGKEVVEIELGRITPGPQQPRTVFNEEALKELAASITEKGVLQPVLVRRTESGFSLIAGERRFRAAKLAGLASIPALVREAEPEDALEISIIENIQRQDLGPIETARAFQRLMKEFKLTQEVLARKVGKERATVANYLRLLKLPGKVKDLINDGRLSMGHARALLAAETAQAQTALAARIVRQGLSVREAERLAGKAAPAAKKPPARKDPNVKNLEDKLIRHLGTKVHVKDRGGKGSVEIEYYSLEELDRLLDVLLS
jgi:ParB family chromosome partitioning protein